MIKQFSEYEHSHAKKNKDEKDQSKISRRDFLKVAGATGAATVLSGIAKPAEAMSRFWKGAKEEEPATSIKWHENNLIKENKWIKDEILSFLGQKEVKKVLGFNPVNSEVKSKLRIEEASIANDNGYVKDDSISINGFLFSEGDPKKYLLNNFFTEEDLKKPHFKKAFEFYDKITSDKEVLKLYRNLLIVHEYSHVGEFYKKGKATHKITDRKEIQLLARLYQSKKISDELFEKTLSIYADYHNEDGSEELINEIRKEIKKMPNNPQARL